MRAELLTIGSELTSGSTVNTNAAYLARQLSELGIPCLRQVTVSDERERVAEALREAIQRAEIVITTGGLGPTFDDITMETIARVTELPLQYVPTVAARIRRFYTRRHRSLQRAALRQAYLPRGGQALSNAVGTAAGLWLTLPDTVLIALPGVPGEMRAIMEQQVAPRLKRLPGRSATATTLVRTVGIVELSIQALLPQLRIPKAVDIGLYPHLRTVDIRLTATASSRAAARRMVQQVAIPLRRRLGDAVYGTDHETLEGTIGGRLRARGLTLAVAESCTGGLVTDCITDVPGSSRYLRGGIVAYHNDLKRLALGVSQTVLARDGAVSAPCAKAMARGVRRFAGADIGLSITGIAGPSGGSAAKPVGLVYIALSQGRSTRSLQCQFFGDRGAIKTQAAQTALDYLRRHLLGDR